MTRPVATSSLRNEFNAFLFAPLGNNSNGMQVSVLSGLAQSDLDPWEEAAALAQLPGETAIGRLALLIGKMPDRGSTYPDAASVATRLIALLPRQLVGSHEPSQSLGAMINSRPWWVYVVIMSFVLGSQFMIAKHQLPTRSGAVDANASAASLPAPPLK